ncbi:PTS fructose transporter subunit IIA [Paenibacillus antibioticophila]|uniref:PTS fructose transporter subunit IIA n=1 Tax=Paenibacillus antibioticophila TaxID=1274374 RepID=A0A919XMW5_9BACL|nr:helix-turn-helix domain-containing protein [Paenibacillus antibioticophila]GIO35942.1 PTS fructose transporter subunit IIA [Paenibacillus antibioticophila]
MFSKRQKMMLSYIYGASDEIRLDILADILHVSVQTARSELDRMNDILEKNGVSVVMASKGGCRIRDEDRTAIFHLLQSTATVDKNNLESRTVWRRINVIVGMLVFERDYISMEDLAERLYVSKSTMNLDISEVKRIVTRISGVSLEISKTSGLIIRGKETDIRYLLSKMVHQGLEMEEAIRHTAPQIRLDEIADYRAIQVLVRSILVSRGHLITGKAFGLVCADILVSSVRNYLGFRLTPGEAATGQLDEFAPHPLVLELAERLERELGLVFAGEDIAYLQRSVMEQNLFYAEGEGNSRDQQAAEIFYAAMKKWLGIDLYRESGRFHSQFMFYLNQLNQRVANGHDYTNFFKRQTNRMFPMSASLVAHCGPMLREQDFRYSEAELAYIALLLGSQMEKEQAGLRILLVSDEHTALVNWIESELYRIFGRHIATITSMPRYLYEESREGVGFLYDLALTTEALEADTGLETIFVHSLLGETEVMLLRSQLDQYMRRRKEEQLKKIADRYIGGQIYMMKEAGSLEQAVAELLTESIAGIAPETLLERCLIPMDTRIAYLSSLTEGTGSFIKIGRLPKPLIHKSKTIQTVILSAFDASDVTEAVLFFQCIERLLNPRLMDKWSKIKSYEQFKDAFLT